MKTQSIPIINHHVALVETESLQDTKEFVEKLANQVVEDLELVVVKKYFKSFKPSGSTLVYLLSQSHLAVHTWPESGIIHVDLVMCVDRDRELFTNALKKALSEHNIKSFEVKTVNFDKL